MGPQQHGQRPAAAAPIHHPALAAEAVIWTAKNPQREVWVGWPSWKAIIGYKLFPGFLDRYVASEAWEGQFAGRDRAPGSPDNLFTTVEGLHSEEGPFSDRTVTKKPVLWHVKNHNLWINGATACLAEPDPGMMADCIRSDLDCADLCRVAAAAMARGSDSAKQICRLCAELCDKCAEICKKHDHDHCKECAKACRSCANECRKMAA